MCKQYFCYGCLLVRGEMETHSRSKIDPERNQCKTTVGELKRNKLDISVIQRLSETLMPCEKCQLSFKVVDIRGHECKPIEYPYKTKCRGCNQQIPN